MAIEEIPFSGGAFQSVDDFELIGTQNGAALENLLLNDIGSNLDRPGLGPVDGFAEVDGPCIGSYYFKNNLIFVTNQRSIYSMNSAGVVSDITGVKLGGTGRPVFASDGQYLAIAGGSKPIRYSGSGLTENMPGDPPICTHILYLDGYWIANISGSQEYQFAGPTESLRGTWDAGDFSSAEGLPDNINAIATSIRELYLFGDNSVEILQNYGQADVPFVRTFFLDRGLSAPYSVVNANNTLYWLDSDRRFVQLAQRTPQFISTPFHRIIQQFDTVSDCFGYKVDYDEHFLIVWKFPTEKKTFWFDYKTNNWGEFKGFEDGLDADFPLGSYCYFKDNNSHFIGSSRESLIWKFSTEYSKDGSSEMRRIRRSSFVNHGGFVRKRSNSYRIWLKRGQGASLQTHPKMEIRFRDDGKPWTYPIQIDLGEVGDFSPYVEVRHRDIYRSRQIELSWTADVRVWVSKVEEDFEVMTS